MTKWKRTFPVVFLGPCGHVNIAARVSKSALAEFIHEAKLSAAVLEKGGRTAFEQVFLVSMYPAVRFDVHMHITLSRDETAVSGSCDNDMVSWRAHEAQVNDVATKALGNRAKLIRVQHQPFVNGSDIRPSVDDMPTGSTKKRKSSDAKPNVENEDLRKVWIGIDS